MFSRFFARFDTKPKPVVIRPTIERTDWYVSQPLHTVRFEDKAWGLQWCEQHGFSSDALQTRQQQFTAEEVAAQEHALNYMPERAEKGECCSGIDQDTPACYLDNFFSTFTAQPETTAAGNLLVMAFSVNRVDIAQYIGGLLTKSFEYWKNPISPPQYGDPDEATQANNAFMQGFNTMLTSPRQMQWFFEHNPALLDKLGQPENLAKLEMHIARKSQATKLMWPLVAYTVFKQSIHPVLSNISAYWDLGSQKTWNDLMLSYAQDPAAQCTLVRMAKDMHWFFNSDSTLVATMDKAHPFVSPEAIALRRFYKNGNLADLDDSIAGRVLFLDVGLQENPTHEAFYEHARAVLLRAPRFTLDLPDINSSDTPGMYNP